MIKRFEKNILLKSLLGLFLAFLLFFTQGAKIPLFDQKANLYFEEAITKATLAYATTRVVNATVSVIKESKLQLEPAGLGVSIAVGQVLDPIDDMVERVSNVLVLAITSLGIQKLLFEIAISVFPLLFACVLVCASLLIWFESIKVQVCQNFLLRLSILLIVARLCLPFSSLVNDMLYKIFLNQISTNQE